MDDEKLFEMLDACIARAVTTLESTRTLKPFAMTLEADDTAQHLAFDENLVSAQERDLGGDYEKHYTLLLEALKAEAQKGEIKAAAILAPVTIPENFGPEVSEGIRIHLEERASSREKLSARFLYIPYQLFKTADDETITVHLYNPIPVGFPPEIFVC